MKQEADEYERTRETITPQLSQLKQKSAELQASIQIYQKDFNKYASDYDSLKGFVK